MTSKDLPNITGLSNTKRRWLLGSRMGPAEGRSTRKGPQRITTCPRARMRGRQHPQTIFTGCDSLPPPRDRNSKGVQKEKRCACSLGCYLSADDWAADLVSPSSREKIGVLEWRRGSTSRWESHAVCTRSMILACRYGCVLQLALLSTPSEEIGDGNTAQGRPTT